MLKLPFYYLQKDNIESKTFSYRVIDFLGKGSFGQVFKCRPNNLDINNSNIKQHGKDAHVAIKCVSMKDFEQYPEEYIYFKREIEIIKEADHLNVLKCFQCSEDLYQKYYLIVTEICNKGNLAQYIKSVGKQIQISNKTHISILSEEVSISLVRQILKAFHYLHNYKKRENKVIVHRDIKMENILVSDGILKVGDFGFARVLEEGKFLDSNVGSPKTKAPEIALEKGYDSKVDVYSLGIVFYQMLFGVFPFQKRTALENAQLCKQNQLDLEKYSIQIKESTKAILSKMITFDPKNRHSFTDLFQIFNIGEGATTLLSKSQRILASTNYYSNNQNNIQTEKLKIKVLGLPEGGKKILLKYQSQKNKNITFSNIEKKNYKLFLSSTSGLEKYNSLPDQELRADGFIIIVSFRDADDPLKDIIQFWLHKIYTVLGDDTAVKQCITVLINTQRVSLKSENTKIENSKTTEKGEGGQAKGVMNQENELVCMCQENLGINASIFNLQQNIHNVEKLFLEKFVRQMAPFIVPKKEYSTLMSMQQENKACNISCCN